MRFVTKRFERDMKAYRANGEPLLESTTVS